MTVFFSSAHGTFSRTDHILEYTISLKNFKRIEIISRIFSDHNDRRLEINDRKRNEKKSITWRSNSMLLKNQYISDEINKEIKKYLEENDNENTTIQYLWDTAKAVIKGKFIAIQVFLQKQEKSQINNL